MSDKKSNENGLQPTVVWQSSVASPVDESLDVSRAQVGFVAGDKSRFSDETAKLLHGRLAAAALVIAVTLAAAFVGNLVVGTTTLWWMRALILMMVIAVAILLRRLSTLKLSQLRILELLVFGSLLFQVSVMMLTRVSAYVATNDSTSLVSIYQQFMTAFCIIVSIYGILVPNTWRRGMAVMLPMALLPYLLIQLQRFWSPDVAALLDLDQAHSDLPFPLVAALVAVFGSHVINSARRAEYKARQFGQYRLMQPIGSGGMGEVYKAEHMLLKRPCAIKLIKPTGNQDTESLARFEREVKATAKLSHWNSIDIYDYGMTDDGTFYYVMELLPGMSVDDIVENHGPLPPQRLVHLLRQVCGALHEAHGVGLIHRDIKPANIFVARRGGIDDVAKLLDFGLVKEQSENSSGDTVRTGFFSGTPLYMSPEQAAAYDEVDGRADIYSLGAVAYHLLTGQPPFHGKNVMELLSAHRSAAVPKCSDVNAAIPADLEQIISKCLPKNPQQRFQNVDELRNALEQCSVADQWGPELAASWWQTHADVRVEQVQHKTIVAETVDAHVSATTSIQQDLAESPGQLRDRT